MNMARDSNFYSELKQLNEDFFRLIETTHKKSPYFDLTPTLKDYIKQFNEIDEKYPERPKPTATNINTNTGFGQSSPASNLGFTNLAAASAATTTSNTTNATIGFNSQMPIFASPKSAQTLQQSAATTVPSVITNAAAASSALNPQAPIFTPISSNPSSFTPLFSAGLTSSTTNSAIKMSSSASISTTPSTTNLFGSSLTNNTTTSATQPTSFFSFSMANRQATNNTGNFTFGNMTNTNTITTAATTNVFNNSKNNDPNETTATADGDAGGEEDTAPPEPNVDKYEEPDARYQVRCKLYERGRMNDGTASINLIGFGVLFVKSMDTANKLQVVFRQDPDLRKVLVNEVITPQIPVKQIGKTVQMLIPGPAGETKFYFAKVREEKDATELNDLLKSIKQ